MSEQSNSSAASNELPNKDYLYGDFRQSAKWRDDLHRKAAHKSLDIADGDLGNIETDRSTTITGLGWKELAVLSALGLGGIGMTGLLGLGAWLVATMNREPTQPPAAPAPQAAEISVSEAFDLYLVDEAGKSVPVQPWPGAAPKGE